jgi:hypothetical protein
MMPQQAMLLFVFLSQQLETRMQVSRLCACRPSVFNADICAGTPPGFLNVESKFQTLSSPFICPFEGDSRLTSIKPSNTFLYGWRLRIRVVS